MIRDLTTYSAATAKCRAMYGKRLTDQDWERLTSAKDLRAVWDVLSRSPAWTAVAERPQGAEELDPLLEGINEQLHQDCHNLGRFLPKEDRAIIEMFQSHLTSPMDAGQYQLWWSSAGRRSRELRRLVGAEADALNLVYVLRLRRFPASIGRAPELLIPIHDELKPEFIQRLLHASTDAVVLELLAHSPWKHEFKSLAPGVLEKQYETYMRAFCRRMLASANPGPQEVQAFLTLKDMDRKRLADIVAAVYNGIDPHRVV